MHLQVTSVIHHTVDLLYPTSKLRHGENTIFFYHYALHWSRVWVQKLMKTTFFPGHFNLSQNKKEYKQDYHIINFYRL